MPVTTYDSRAFEFIHIVEGDWQSLRFIVRETTIRLYVTPTRVVDHIYVASEATEIISITRTTVGRWLGNRTRSYQYLATELKTHLRTNGYLTQQYVETFALDTLAQAIISAAQDKWPPCVCGDTTTEEHEHVNCSSCLNTTNESTLADPLVYETAMGEINRTYRVCPTCYDSGRHDGVGTCFDCGTYTASDTTTVADQEGYGLCNACASNRNYCASCDAYFLDQSFISDAESCITCAEENIPASIHPWDYIPEYMFHPPIPADPKQPLYIGIELEIATNNFGMDRYRYNQSVEDLAPLIYGKEDSSVNNGFELVSHPMAPRWALDHFPFEAVEKFEALGAYKTHESTGTHIHINKDSLTPAHLWKFLQIHFRLAPFCQLVGGRGDVTYARFEATDMVTQRANLLDLVQKKDRNLDEYDRYLAINLKNEYTIELRYMRGSIVADEIRKNIEWVLALYEFSAYLSIADVRNGALSDQGYLLHWIQHNDYPYLMAWIDERVPTPRPLESRA